MNAIQSNQPAGISDTILVVPARFASTRFPGKPLVQIAGHSMISRVWRIAVEALRLSGATAPDQQVLVATDDSRIEDHCRAFGALSVMTPDTCENGSERAHAATAHLPETVKFVINLQGDSPLVPPAALAQLILVRRTRNEEIITACVELSSSRAAELRSSPNLWGAGTYVTRSENDSALYFSRYPIPFQRDAKSESSQAPLLKHIGVYGFTRASLAQYVTLPPGQLESFEKLEQLRALAHGMRIVAPQINLMGRTLVSVDTPEDAQRATEVIQREGELIP